MITKQKFLIYKKYKGDLDLWIRDRRKKDISIIDDGDWQVISELLSDILLIENNLVSDDFRNKVIQSIKSNSESEEVMSLLKVEAKKLNLTHEKTKIYSPASNLLLNILKWLLGYFIFRLIIYVIFGYPSV
ncbi:hypothetical protein [Hymenobacter terrestris]|uniref:Uncharacterized protein n=1 Tax=Hymenobacter terrestris TaxID=2748310 RepID=A0ABX2Q1G9_9BACT|nr:hypothetical protein [Hymenobacter terrestris]NVO84784.1 hypothetical protein [Hymenobacter terrestris]